MPTRILRDGILESQRVNRLSDEEEVFYRRLMSIVDDYGCYEAHAALLRARMYPLKLDKVTPERIIEMLVATMRERLVFIYTVNGKVYLQLLSFNQQMRSKCKHPLPSAKHVAAFAKQPLSDASRCLADAKQMLTDVHLVGVVFVGVDEDGVGDGVGVGGEVVVVAESASQTDDFSSKERKPKSIEAVMAYGAEIGVKAVQARRFFEYNSKRKWKAVRHMEGDSWRALMAVWKQKGEEGFGPSPPDSKNSADGTVPFDSQKPNAHTGGLAVVN